jgi:hypothetical protein
MSASPSNPNAEEISFEEVGPSSSRRLAASAAVLSAAAASILTFRSMAVVKGDFPHRHAAVNRVRTVASRRMMKAWKYA